MDGLFIIIYIHQKNFVDFDDKNIYKQWKYVLKGEEEM